MNPLTLPTPRYVRTTAAARDAAYSAVVEAIGAVPTVTTATRRDDGETVHMVTVYESTATYGYRARRYNGQTEHTVNGGPVLSSHRKARELSRKIDAAGTVLDAYLTAHLAADRARNDWHALTFYAVRDIVGAVVETHATREGAEMGAARHRGSRIVPPAVLTCDAVIGGARTTCSGAPTEIFHGRATPARACARHMVEEPAATYAGHDIRRDSLSE